MINKPKKLGYPDLLRASDEKQRKALVQANNKEHEKYQNNILTKLIEEFGTASLGELLFCVVERHHKTLKIKEKRGTKQQWSTLLGAAIKIEVDKRRDCGLTLKAVIKQMVNDPLWKQLILNSEEQFKKIYKQKHEPQTYKYAQHIHRSKEEWSKLIEDEISRFFRK